LAPLVSVIIPTYNRAFCLARAVDSVLRQTFPDFELLVIDDGSVDKTPELLAPKIGANFFYVQEKINKGVSAARNLGARLAKGSWLAFLDSDDEWAPQKLSEQMLDLKENRDLLVSQCQEIWFRGQRRVNPGLKHQKKAGDIFLESLSICLISPSAIIINKDLFWALGGFDETLPACEDYDLWLRLTAQHPVGLLDKPLVTRHGGRPDQLSAGWGLDRYRIKALEKIIQSGLLDAPKKMAAELELARRKRIFEAGRLKRERLIDEKY
jgi:glycosyltransferase involved in cell wall biosynthesis